MLLLALLLGCPQAVDLGEPPPELLVLVSFDGARWDYPGRAQTPTLDRVAAEGVRAEALIPAFPSKTFPNHYTLVTGLYPEAHGLVENTIYDPERDAWYLITDSAAVGDARWYAGEPIWATAQAQGLSAATVYWVGSEAAIGGVRPDLWLHYDGSLSFNERVDQALAWLDRPSPPDLLTLYLDEPDHAGHAHGPDGDEVVEAIEAADAALGRLVEGLEARGRWENTNLVVVSDHGMAGLSPERVVFLDDYIDLREVEVINWSPAATMYADAQAIDGLLALLAEAEHVDCARKEDLPEALHYAAHPLIPPLVCVAEPGWALSSHAYADAVPDAFTGGTHGWTPDAPDMQGIFYARGPAFAEGLVAPAFESVEVYNLLAYALGVTPAENSGDLERVHALLREAP
ncbi:MAG: alkaline phosphatase family protein [Alphaproteobacteria bacterium]|nr:alkaline phosphatase family protein [Alphaproteobacteria bacterium]